MPKLTIDTGASLFEPIEVEIDGETFAVKRINRDLLRQVQELDGQIGAGDIDAAYRRLELLIGEHECIGKLDLDQILKITTFITESLFKPRPAEKNAQSPGAAE